MVNKELEILEGLADETGTEIMQGLAITVILADRVKNYNRNKRLKEKEAEYYNSLSYAERIAYDIRKANKGTL